MFSFFKKNPCEVDGNNEIIINVSRHIAQNAINKCVESYYAWSRFIDDLKSIKLSSDKIFEGSYHFWLFNLSSLFTSLLKNHNDFQDSSLEIFVESVFHKIYSTSRSYFIQFIKQDFQTSYFTFLMPAHEVIIDNVNGLLSLSLMIEGCNDFDSRSSIGLTYLKYIKVVQYNTDIVMRARIFNSMLNSIVIAEPIFQAAFKMMRDNIRVS